jgi:hypothetical protein
MPNRKRKKGGNELPNYKKWEEYARKFHQRRNLNPRKDDPQKQLAALKIKLVTESNFNEIFHYFFDHFGENDTFLKMGKPTRHSVLEQIIAQAAAQVARQQIVVLQNLFLIGLAEEKFIHGGCYFNDKYVANFFYFEDIDAGMISIGAPTRSEETLFARFSCKAVEGEGEKKSPSN